jgi:Domain of unknown function (4846)
VRRTVVSRILVVAVGLGSVSSISCKHEAKPGPTVSSAAPESSVAASASGRSAGATPSASAATAGAVNVDAGSPDAATGAVAGQPDAHRYRWLGADNLKFPAAVDTLEARFPAPPGYVRVAVTPGSFAEWLRGLPLAAPGTPVLSHAGDTVFAGDDAYVASVVAIDVGAGDLQQSADAVIRLHGEWLWSSDQPNAISYKSATKLDMPFSRWAKGQRLLAAGPNMGWVVKGKPKDPTYNDFRQYIDAVMLWSNNVSLAMRATRVADPAQLSAGDFFLQTRGKGHAILVLDVAQKPTGERVALLGQSLQSPAQSIHVMGLGQATAWFSMRPPNPVLTPRADEFLWTDLMRLEAPPDAAKPTEKTE